MLNRHESVKYFVDPFFEQIDHYKIYKKHEFSIHFLILQHFSFSATFIWPQLESNYWTYIHELKKLGNSFTSELLIRNGNKTLCFLKAKLAFINLFLCMLKLEPRKVPIFYYIIVTSKSAILWTKEHFIIHYKPRCMLFRFVLLFLGPKSGTKRGLTVLTKFHDDWRNIVDFLIWARFKPCPILERPPCTKLTVSFLTTAYLS